MIRGSVCVAAIAAAMFVAACGGGQNSTEKPAAPAVTPSAPATAASATPPKPAGTLTLLEPIDGAMSGHIDTFRWSPVSGADGYVIQIKAVTGDRVVWESAPLTEAEAKLPPTVTARKGSDIIATSVTQKFTITP
jgi:hypothetical protein